MTKPSKSTREQGAISEPPEKTLEGTPPLRSGAPSHDFYTQYVWQISEALGKLQEGVSALQQRALAHDDELKRVGKEVHTGKTILIIFGSIFSVLLAAGATGVVTLAVHYIELHITAAPH